ncbi:MAG: ribonuclease J [Dehalococcoidia bacterium]
MSKAPLKVIPLGGLGEIGKNMLVLEYANDIIVIDAGVMFPAAELPGIDLIIPDISYLMENRSKVRGIVITHGHEDHTGALPYVVRQLKAPIFAPTLAEGLISVKLKEHGCLKGTKLHAVAPGDRLKLGAFQVEMFRVCHSIPDAMGLAIGTPIGTVVHSGDFKFDHTPVDGRPSDLSRLAQLGAEGVLLLLSDSTYAELPGYTPSERVVSGTMDRIMAKAEGRVIVSTFASLISRVQQVVDAAVMHNRKICVEGRSMVETVKMATKLGYLNIPEGTLVSLDEVPSLPHKRVVIILTGTQGEPSSALARVANREHKQLQIVAGDTVVISATPIPGNQLLISNTIDNLFRQGAQVLYDKLETVHVHGHASQEELKMMISLTNPRFFVPVHGEFRHLVLHAQLAQSLGVSPDNTFVMEDGDVLELTPRQGRIGQRVRAGAIYVDGLGAWDMNSKVIRDRKTLARDGVVIVAIAVDKRTGKVVSTPDVITHGFVDTGDADALIDATHRVLGEALDGSRPQTGAGCVKSTIKDVLSKFYLQETKRRPMILPIAVEV